MARHGIKGIIGGGAATGGASDKSVAGVAARRSRAHGRETELGGDLIIGLTFHIADTRGAGDPRGDAVLRGVGEDVRAARLRARAERRADRGGRRSGAGASGQLPTLRDAVKAGRLLAGPPEHIRDRLLELQDRYPGLEQVNVGQVVGTPKRVILEQLERFAVEVMPTFKKQPAVAGR